MARREITRYQFGDGVRGAILNILGRPIARRHLLHIDLGNLYHLWNALCVRVCGEKSHAQSLQHWEATLFSS
jgi:hypothetical protein